MAYSVIISGVGTATAGARVEYNVALDYSSLYHIASNITPSLSPSRRTLTRA